MGEFSGTDLEVASIVTVEPDPATFDDDVVNDVRADWTERLRDRADCHP
ncbi:hypothetical protein [Nocardioides sp. B-3]|nr:hypothetical protein [Nocardioides sp. B-3]UUZ58697.1 hypothetical protein LP418_21670 [Nocardioides sp. B-3]